MYKLELIKLSLLHMWAAVCGISLGPQSSHSTPRSCSILAFYQCCQAKKKKKTGKDRKNGKAMKKKGKGKKKETKEKKEKRLQKEQEKLDKEKERDEKKKMKEIFNKAKKACISDGETWLA